MPQHTFMQFSCPIKPIIQGSDIQMAYLFYLIQEAGWSTTHQIFFEILKYDLFKNKLSLVMKTPIHFSLQFEYFVTSVYIAYHFKEII